MHDVPGRDPRRTGDVVRPAGPGHADPEVRAGLRLLLALAGAGLLALVLGPVALLVHDAWDPLVDLDLSVSGAAERAVSASPGLLTAARLATHLGDPFAVTGLALGAAVLLHRSGRRRSALFLVVVRTGALVLSQGTKAAVGRARPAFEEPVASAFGASFPSGHALGAAAVWSALAVVLLPLVPRPARVPLLGVAVAVAVLVCATRVLLGVHYLSDVVAGLVVGLAWTALCTAVFALWRQDEGRPGEVLDDGVEQDEADRP